MDEEVFQKLAIILKGRIILLGVGNEMKGDDGAGVFLARLLQEKITSDTVDIIDAGAAPENYVDIIVKSKPDVLLILDAAMMGREAGDLMLVQPQDLLIHGYSTHCLSLGVICRYLEVEAGCRIYLLLIQPETTAYGESLSKKIRQKLHDVAGTLEIIIRRKKK